jgi:hypothetical protein
MTIDEFFAARLDELEALARRAIESDLNQWGVSGFEIRYVSPDSLRGDGLGASVAMTVSAKPAAHIAQHDPAYVLADVAAKRKIIEHHKLVPGEHRYRGRPAMNPKDPRGCNVCHEHDGIVISAGPCLTLRLLVQPFSEHPDFSPEWKTP